MSSKMIKNKLIDFIKYHNGFVIGLVLAFVFGGVILASEDARGAVVGEEIVTQSGVDNSVILNADLDDFDFAMTIGNVFEDENNYYVEYSFATLGIEDNIWRQITRELEMIISKDAVLGKDLGVYVTEELSEIADHELAYLKQVQAAEIEKGETRIVRTTKYTGLIGLVLDTKEKILPGYEPVLRPKINEMAANDQQSQEQVMRQEEQEGADDEVLDIPIGEELQSATSTQETATPSSASSAVAPQQNSPLEPESESAIDANNDNQSGTDSEGNDSSAEEDGSTTEEAIIPELEPTETPEPSESESESESEPADPAPEPKPEPEPEPESEN